VVVPTQSRNGITIRLTAMTEAAVNRAVQRACTRGLGRRSPTQATLYAPGSPPFVAQGGASDRAIARQERHRPLAGLDAYIRVENARHWTENSDHPRPMKLSQ
jgi:hypothetical protein